MPVKIEGFTYKAKNSINDTFIINHFFSKNKKRIIKDKLNNIPKEILSYLNKRYNDSSCIEETIFRILKNIEKHPLCPICNKPVKYVGGTRFYLKTCGDNECSEKQNKISLQKTVQEKYGVDNIAKLEENKNKVKNTNIERYGTLCPLQNHKIKKKTEKTNLQKYGTKISQSSEEIRTKISNSHKNLRKTN